MRPECSTPVMLGNETQFASDLPGGKQGLVVPEVLSHRSPGEPTPSHLPGRVAYAGFRRSDRVHLKTRLSSLKCKADGKCPVARVDPGTNQVSSIGRIRGTIKGGVLVRRDDIGESQRSKRCIGRPTTQLFRNRLLGNLAQAVGIVGPRKRLVER